MVVKIYGLIWLLVVAFAGFLFVTGNLDELSLTVFGFVLATLAATGLVAVLPWWIDKKYTWKYEDK